MGFQLLRRRYLLRVLPAQAMLAAILWVLCFTFHVLPARAELVILGDGSFFKVKDFRLDGEHAVLTLRGGGWMALPIERIERVIDDEVLEPDPPAPKPAPAAVAVPALPLRFDPKQAVPEGPWGGMI